MRRRVRRLHIIALTIASLPALPAAAQQTRGGGSEAPCAVPLHWRVTRVDREFGLDIPAATAIVREATEMWQAAATQPLFMYDETDGFPIRLVYDERQEQNDARLRSQRALDQERQRLEAERAEIDRRAGRHEEAVRLHQERVRELESRVAAHNAEVRGWNERGGAPPDTRTDLEAVSAALAAERSELAAAARALDAEADEVRRVQDRLARDVAEFNRELERHARQFPPSAVRSGEYREAVQRVGGRVVGISREVRIYRFADREELRLVAAHELGHALGLGHVVGETAETAVMSEQHDGGSLRQGIDRLGNADAALLAATCPAVVSEGR